MPTLLSFVRHGQVYNPDQIYYGRLPGFRLDAKGRDQAKLAARVLRSTPLAALFSSPQLRARQTAREILRFHPRLKLKISRLLDEVYTPYEGHPSAQTDAINGDVYTGTSPPFEQPVDIVNRAQKFVRRIRKRFAGRQVAAVTHGDTITFMILWAKGLALEPAYKGKLAPFGIPDGYPAPASITTFAFKTDAPDELPRITYVRPY
jgi:probable phosphoglycerate mutase